MEQDKVISYVNSLGQRSQIGLSCWNNSKRLSLDGD